ncbi:Na+/melibiose symporter-like transporter [Kitasatospora sp. MAA4]|uniref:MFS transporter n=1 Tax=Kitasatospora sp. MAA4 TaxID=3035093 RepID=UPI00247495C8|nr:MFS transporter [Kitasatospora sp. MAA4]MDH6134223.1 Na+/melibiose symporter-like transporter [Kitasatospora sp. MAA4]
MNPPAVSRSIYRHRGFLALWSAVTVSGIGSQVTAVALPLTAMLTLHADALQLGTLAMVQTLPVLFVTPVAGVVVDRFPVKLINALCDVVRGVLLLAVPVLAALDGLSLLRLYVLGLLVGCFKALADVAHHSILPQVIEEHRLVAGNAAINTSYSVTDVAGPGLGGVLTQLLSAPQALIADSVSFFLSAGLIASLRVRPVERAPRQRWSTMAREGFGYLFGQQGLLTLALCSGVANLFLQAYSTVLVIFVVRSLGLPSSVLGAVYACGALGGVAGSALAERIGRVTRPTTAMMGGLLGTGLGMAGLATADLVAAPWARIAILIAGTAAYTAGLGVYNVHAMSTRQKLVQRDMLGRVTASYRLLSHGALPVGSLLGGLGAQRLGAPGAVALSGAGVVAWVGVLLLTPFRRLPQ